MQGAVGTQRRKSQSLPGGTEGGRKCCTEVTLELSVKGSFADKEWREQSGRGSGRCKGHEVDRVGEGSRARSPGYHVVRISSCFLLYTLAPFPCVEWA